MVWKSVEVVVDESRAEQRQRLSKANRAAGEWTNDGVRWLWNNQWSVQSVPEPRPQPSSPPPHHSHPFVSQHSLDIPACVT